MFAIRLSLPRRSRVGERRRRRGERAGIAGDAFGYPHLVDLADKVAVKVAVIADIQPERGVEERGGGRRCHDPLRAIGVNPQIAARIPVCRQVHPGVEGRRKCLGKLGSGSSVSRINPGDQGPVEPQEPGIARRAPLRHNAAKAADRRCRPDPRFHRKLPGAKVPIGAVGNAGIAVGSPRLKRCRAEFLLRRRQADAARRRHAAREARTVAKRGRAIRAVEMAEQNDIGE